MIEKTWPITEKIIFNALHLTEQLYQQLIQEADVLKRAPHADLVDNIAANKKQLVMQLEQFNAQCGQILATEKLPNNQEGIKEYFQRAENSGLATANLVDNWRKTQLICAECRDLNEQNGASIELLTYHTKRSLNILKGKTHSSNTYGPDGNAQGDFFINIITLVG